MFALLMPKLWIHGVFCAQCIHSVGHSNYKVAVLKWGGWCLFGLWMPSGVVWRGDGEGCASFAFGEVHAAFGVSWNRVLMVPPFRNNLFAFGKAQKTPKGTYFQSIPGERYNNSSVFSSFSSQGPHPTKTNTQTGWQVACIQHLSKLDQFAKWQWLFS